MEADFGGGFFWRRILEADLILESDFGGGFFWRRILGADSILEADFGGGLFLEADLVRLGADFFSSWKQNLLFCVVIVQEREVYISLFNQGACICAMSSSTIPTEFLNANAVV